MYMYFDDENNSVGWSNLPLAEDRYLEVEVEDSVVDPIPHYYTINRETLIITKGEAIPPSPLPEDIEAEIE